MLSIEFVLLLSYSSEPIVANFYTALRVYKYISWLEIPMQEIR